MPSQSRRGILPAPVEDYCGWCFRFNYSPKAAALCASRVSTFQSWACNTTWPGTVSLASASEGQWNMSEVGTRGKLLLLTAAGGHSVRSPCSFPEIKKTSRLKYLLRFKNLHQYRWKTYKSFTILLVSCYAPMYACIRVYIYIYIFAYTHVR